MFVLTVALTSTIPYHRYVLPVAVAFFAGKTVEIQSFLGIENKLTLPSIDALHCIICARWGIC